MFKASDHLSESLDNWLGLYFLPAASVAIQRRMIKMRGFVHGAAAGNFAGDAALRDGVLDNIAPGGVALDDAALGNAPQAEPEAEAAVD